MYSYTCDFCSTSCKSLLACSPYEYRIKMCCNCHEVGERSADLNDGAICDPLGIMHNAVNELQANIVAQGDNYHFSLFDRSIEETFLYTNICFIAILTKLWLKEVR